MMMEEAPMERPSDAGAANCCYLCNQCTCSFASLEELETHLATHSATGPPESADTEVRTRRADENSPSSSETSFHIDEALQATPASNGEPDEDESTTGPLSPLDAEDDGKPRPFACRFCSKLFTSRSLLNIHYTHTHRDKPQYECEDCGRIFSVKRELATHRRIHSGEQTHACAQCGKEFGTRQLLKKHWMWHTGQRSHVCPHCGKAFFQKGHLTQHLMIHAGGRPHVCQLCSKTFIFKFDLNRHMKIHAERGYACNKCGKAFLKEAALVDHQPKCNGERSTPSPAPSTRSQPRSVPSTPERKFSTPGGLGSDQPSPLSTTTAPLPLFPPQLLPPPPPPGSEASGMPGQPPGSGQPQRIVCLLCMQDFPSQAAYSLHLSYVHLRDAMFSSFQQHQAGGDPMKNPSPVVSMISALSQQQALFRQSSPVIRRASDSAMLGQQLPQPPPPHVLTPPQMPAQTAAENLSKDAKQESEQGNGEEEKTREGERMEVGEVKEEGPEPTEASEGDEEEEDRIEEHLVDGCPGCATARPRLAHNRSRLKDLESSLRARDEEVARLRGKMERVGLIAGSLLESCSEFDKLWILHSKKVYSQIQSVLNSLD